MRNFYITAFLVSIITLLFTIAQSQKSDRTAAAPLRRLLTAAVFAVTGNFFVVLSLNRLVCSVAYSFFFVSIDWIIYFLMCFIIEYTGSTQKHPGCIKIIRLFLYADCFSMLANPFFSHAFSCKTVITGSGEMFYRIDAYLPYTVHLILCYALLSLTFLILLFKIYQTSSLYRGKYIAVLIVVLCVVISDAFYVFLDTVIDFSVFGFVVGGLFLYYLTAVYIPRNALDRMLTTVVHNMRDTIIIFDTEGNCVHANRNAYNWLVTSGKTASDSYFEHWYADIGQHYEMDAVHDFTAVLNDKEHHLKGCRKELLDRHGVYIGSFFHIQDITDDYEKLQKERYLATHDRLTGIYNKERFYEKAEEYLTADSETEYLMLCSDIYNFKLVNDIFGTDCGDAVLIRIANTLQQLCCEEDIYARIGNDRFALLMPKKNFKESVFLNETGKSVYVENDVHYPIKIYIGVYEITQRDIPVSVMLDRALMALLTIKGSYQTSLAFYDNRLRDNFLLEQEIMGQFDHALSSGQFQIYLQPQVNSFNEVHGAEALVRWLHPKKGFMSPADFIPLFEKNGTIVKLDKYVWELACIKLKEWQDAGWDNMYIAVNISPKDFYYIDVCQTISGLVQKYGVNPQNLHLEITETSIMSDVLERISLIARLRSAGFIVEMDDFGSGYSSLNTLKDIHIDTMKIDMVFLQRADDINRSKKILTSVIQLARELDIDSIVEGVETVEQVDFLKQIGCDMFQGYFFARPMPIPQFEQTYM